MTGDSSVSGGSETKTVQVRDLDEDVVDILKVRAAQARMSLSAYVAQVLIEFAASPTNAEVMARARALARAGSGASEEEILAVIREGRDR